MKPIGEQAYFYCAKTVCERSCFTMEPEMEAKLQAVIELCEEGDPEMCEFDRLL